MRWMKVEFYSGPVDTDTTHSLEVFVRLWTNPSVRFVHRAHFPTARTREGVHGVQFPIEDGWTDEFFEPWPVGMPSRTLGRRRRKR